MKAIEWILFEKFGGRSALDYLKETCAKAFERVYQFFLKRKVDDNDHFPSELTPAKKFSFTLESIDAYFYDISKAAKKPRLVRKVEEDNATKVAQTAKSGLPSFNLTGEHFTN